MTARDPLSALDRSKRVKTAAGGHAMTDAEYNRKWFERLMKRTVYTERGCFEWTGPVSPKGYALMTHRSWSNAAHRVVFRLLCGQPDLATEQLVCHRCDNPRCWNPAHLFLGDAAANNRDCGNKGRHHNSVKTHCKRGHEFTPENTYLKVTPTTTMRACLTCQDMNRRKPEYIAKARERQRRRREMKKSQRESRV